MKRGGDPRCKGTAMLQLRQIHRGTRNRWTFFMVGIGHNISPYYDHLLGFVYYYTSHALSHATYRLWYLC